MQNCISFQRLALQQNYLSNFIMILTVFIMFKIMFYFSGLYYKAITIVIMMIVSDATIWSITFDAARGVIYDRNMAIPHVYGTGIICDNHQMTIVIVL